MPILNTFGNGSNKSYGFTSGGPSTILLSATPGPSATISTYSGYIVFKFTATGTLNVGSGAPGTADVFVVGGGVTGGSSIPTPVGVSSGAGGNGGLRTASPGVTITSNTPIPVVVGSTNTASSFGPVTSAGGTAGGTGGNAVPNATSPAPGLPGGNGPTNNYETGSSQNYGGGGGSGAAQGSGIPGGSGGLSGGGSGGGVASFRPFPQGGPVPGPDAQPGVANTGGGGGGGSTPVPKAGGTGGSGVVVVRFPDTQFRTS